MKADPRGVVHHYRRAILEVERGEREDRELEDFLAEEIIRHLERGDELEELADPLPPETELVRRYRHLRQVTASLDTLGEDTAREHVRWMLRGEGS